MIISETVLLDNAYTKLRSTGPRVSIKEWHIESCVILLLYPNPGSHPHRLSTGKNKHED